MARRTAYFIPVDGYVEGKGFNVGIATEDQRGYNITDWWWNIDFKTAQELCDQKNEALGLTKLEAAKVVSSSIEASLLRRPVLR